MKLMLALIIFVSEFTNAVFFRFRIHAFTAFCIACYIKKLLKKFIGVLPVTFIF